MKNVIFLSPPAAGKGTFSDYLISKYGYIHLSTGDVLRQRAQTDEELAEILKSGKFVDDETIMQIIGDKLVEIKDKPFILDGCPRTLYQASLLNKIFQNLQITNIKVIYINTDKDLLIKRVTGRVICPNCHATFNNKIKGFAPKKENICDNCGTVLVHRTDDNLESYELRYNDFITKTAPIIDVYKKAGLYCAIDNNDVDITDALKELEGVICD